MSNTFQNILNMSWTHGYYTTNGNDVTNDLIVTPTASTAEFLNRKKLFLKETAQGFSIYCDNHTLSSLDSILASRTLHFFIQLKNTGFINFTDLASQSTGKDIYYLQCVQSGNPQPSIQVMPLYPPVFTYTFTAPQAAPTLQLTEQITNPAVNTSRFSESFPTAVLNDALSASVDLTNYVSGRYTVSITGQLDSYLYISDEQPLSGIFGVAAITLPDFAGFNPATYSAPEYQFQFSARAAVWQYNITINTYTPAANVTLSGPHPFTAAVGNPSHPYSAGNILRFTSNNTISYQRTPITGINLQSGAVVIYSNLPNPDTDHPVVWNATDSVWVSRMYVTL